MGRAPLQIRTRLTAERLALVGIVAASALLYSSYALLRWWRYDLDSYDLALYHQIVWHLSRLQAPAASMLGESNYLGDHFSPILAAFAPFYRVWPAVPVLLVGQALLVAASIPAVFLYARPRVGPRIALVIAVAYAQCWGVWAVIDFAVHEVAFAAPLVTWTLVFLDRRELGRAYLSLGLLLLVKEDMGLAVAAIGVWLAIQGDRRRGLAIAAAGLAALVIVNELVLPALSHGSWSPREHQLYGRYGGSLGSAAAYLFSHPAAAAKALFGAGEKVRLVVLLLGAFAFLPLLSPLSLIALPLVAERLIANDPHLWAPSYQYSLLPMAVLAMASADALARITRWTRGRLVVPCAFALAVAAISVVSAISFPLTDLFSTSSRQRPADELAAADLARSVPSGASLAADWSVLTHVAPRGGMFLDTQIATARPQFAVLTTAPVRPPAGYRLLRTSGRARLYARTAREPH